LRKYRCVIRPILAGQWHFDMSRLDEW